MKSPIIFIIMFLALSFGIITVRLVDNINNAEPIDTSFIENTLAPALSEIAPSANAAPIINIPPPLAKKPDAPLAQIDTKELALILAQSGNAEYDKSLNAQPIICKIDRQTSCSQKGCNNTETSMWIEIDFANNLYKRCSQKGCEDYRMLINKSQDFSSLIIPASNVSFRISNKENYFSEANSLAGTVVSNFGHCPKVAAYLSSL